MRCDTDRCGCRCHPASPAEVVGVAGWQGCSEKLPGAGTLVGMNIHAETSQRNYATLPLRHPLLLGRAPLQGLEQFRPGTRNAIPPSSPSLVGPPLRWGFINHSISKRHGGVAAEGDDDDA